MRRIVAKFLCIAILSLAFASSVFAVDYPSKSTNFYVNDLANVLSEENEKYIIETNAELYKKTGGQIVVMTVNNLNGQDIETYATGVFRKYGIGDKTKNNGTLILLSIEDRKSRIELGTGTEGFITDGKSGRIQDEYMIPYFKNNDWNTGLRKGFDAILGCYLEEYSEQIDGSTAISVSENTMSNFASIGTPILMIVIIIGMPIVSLICKTDKKIAFVLRVVLGVLGVATYFLLSDPTRVIVFMMIFMIFVATYGIRFSGGGGHGYFGGSSRSSGGHSGGGGSSAGGGSSRSF